MVYSVLTIVLHLKKVKKGVKSALFNNYPL